MAKESLSGKLAVILHADVADSTALVQQDKQLAHERIQDAFKRFSTIIEKYLGQVVELRGDALLAEFERASDAVSAALSFQSDHAYQISRLKDEVRPTVRVGIALGEVIVADSTVTGAGVVQAQRIEQLADPGGVCVTAAIHEALAKRMPFDLEDLGEQVLKGFDIPVRVYRVELSANQSIPPPQQTSVSGTASNKPRLVVAIIVIAFLIAGGATYWFKKQETRVEAASIERMAFPLPGKPSIAVLPFSNLSDDKQQEYFADGMTEDLITDISKLSGLFVIARNSVFTYKGKAVKIRQVAEELGVRYVMEGSVRRVGNQVRINAQLIDATTGGHIWAERYDGSLNDVFSMQDEITQNIVDTLAITLTGQEKSSLAQFETKVPEAYDAFLQGWEHYRRTTPEDFVKAIAFLEQAVVLDSDYARAHSALAAVYWNSAWRRWLDVSLFSYTNIYAKARQSLKKSMKMPSALTHQVAAEMAAYFERNPQKALDEAERAIALDANDPAGRLAMATALIVAGLPNEAIASMNHAMRLDPQYPASYLTRLGHAQFNQGLFSDAISTLESSTKINPKDERAFMYLAAAYGHLDRISDAKTALEETNTLREISGWDALTLNEINYWRWTGDRKKLKAGLSKADVGHNPSWRARMSYFSRSNDQFSIEGVSKINLEEAKRLHDRGVVFINSAYVSATGNIPGAIKLPWVVERYTLRRPREFTKVRLSKILDDNEEFVIFSSDQNANAATASAYAIDNGFENVYYFENGFDEWRKAGYPTE